MTESKGLNIFDRPRPKFRLPIPVPILERMGSVIAWTSLLESNVQTVANTLIGADRGDIGRVVTCDLSFPRLVSLVRTLYVTRFGLEDPYERLDDLLKQAERLYTRRGAIVHSVYGPGWENGVVRIKSRHGKAGLKVDFERLQTEDLDHLADDIQTCAMDFVEILIALHNRPSQAGPGPAGRGPAE